MDFASGEAALSPKGGGGSLVAHSAGGSQPAYERPSAGGGVYTKAFVKLQQAHPDKSVDEIAEMMTDFRGAEGTDQDSELVQTGRARGEGAGRKVGLFIGNDDYVSLPPLKFAVSDAQAMKSTYAAKKYQATHEKNRSASDMAQSFETTAATLEPGDHMIFYYAGHGAPEGIIGVLGDGGQKDVLPYAVLNGVVNMAEARGFHLTAILDSCSSGAATALVRRERIAELADDGSLDDTAQHMLSIVERLEVLRDAHYEPPRVLQQENDPPKAGTAASEPPRSQVDQGGSATNTSAAPGTRDLAPLSPPPRTWESEPRWKQLDGLVAEATKRVRYGTDIAGQLPQGDQRSQHRIVDAIEAVTNAALREVEMARTVTRSR